MKTVRYVLMVCVLVWLQGICYGQEKKDTIPPPYIKGKVVLGEQVLDTLPPNADSLRGRKHSGKHSAKTDSVTTVKKKHDPHKATLYSTFCPGLGQIYNRKYWKLPLVYAAVGIPVYTYFYNRDWYKKCQYALAVVLSPNPTQDSLNRVDPKLKVFVTTKDDASIRTYRNEFRKDQDYSVIFLLLFWGLQIVDATVDAHLMNFDISPELSLHLRDGSGSRGNPLLPGSASPAGIGLAFDLHKARYKPIPLP
ncbi:MAG: hypothetical protein J0H74_05170 [Chitinophagaceae bacterium]|nr:hypothetical protein [Chitinophagaceae bacterium]